VTTAETTIPTAAATTARPGTSRPRGALGHQAVALAGQLGAGVGNLGFTLVAARVLAPGEFAALAAFLAVYLLIHVPAASLGAGAALDPIRLAGNTRTFIASGVTAGLVLAATAPWVGQLLNLPTATVLALAAAMPAAGLLGIRRGILYGTGRTPQVAASLAAEPAVRLLAGVPLMLVGGPAGGAVAVAAGGWAGLAVASRAGTVVSGPDPTPAPTDARRGLAGFTVATFLAFAVIANQDLLVANAVLDPREAGGFAVLSVLGSAVAFATATIPMVLLPAAAASTSVPAVRTALGLTAVASAGAVLLGAVASDHLIEIVFGAEHLHVAPLVAPYLVAMAFLAIGRVIAARHCATGRGHLVSVVVAGGVVLHLTALLAWARTPGAVVATTLIATATSCLALVAVPSLDRRLATRDSHGTDLADLASRWRDLASRPDVVWVVGVTAAAVMVRLMLTRGLWVDEAISVAQAQLPLGQMLDELRWSDVHPPLHHLILWVTVRIAGTGELVVRLPSILAGAALVPVLYLLGRDLYGRATGRIAAAAGAVAPFLVWYSQEARMYSLFMLAATVAVLGQVRVLRSGSLPDWVLYTVATAAMAWTQYFAIIPIAVQQIAFIGFMWHRRQEPGTRRFARAWAGSLVAIVLVIAPVTPIALDQYQHYLDRRAEVDDLSVAPAGHGPVDTSSAQAELSVYAVVANGVWALWGYHADDAMAQIAALWPLGMLAALVALGHGRSRDTSLLVALIAVPALALFAAGTLKRDLFELRYFSGAVPLAVLLAARVATRITTATLSRAALGLVLVATLTLGLVDQQLNGTNPRRYDFDGALNSVHATWEPGDVLLYEPLYLDELVEYYGPDLASRPISHLTRPSVSAASTVYVLATERVINERETAARVGDVLAQLENQGREVVARIDHPNVTVWELR
jgi:O-antigen/teichoic acid export membrane protein/4-amino-4-deoxy-L-arabinose transferase-like glycosyltransferase